MRRINKDSDYHLVIGKAADPAWEAIFSEARPFPNNMIEYIGERGTPGSQQYSRGETGMM